MRRCDKATRKGNIISNVFLTMPKRIIPLLHDYNVNYNFQSLQRSPKELLHPMEGNIVKKFFHIGDEKVLVSIIPEDDHFKIAFYPNQPDEATKVYILAYINEWFDLTSDLSPFYALAIKDKLMKPV